MSVSQGLAADMDPQKVSFLRGKVVRLSVGALAIVLAVAGTGVLARPFLTSLWADYKQDQLSGQVTTADLREGYRSGDVEVGHGLTRLRIPKLGVNVVVVEGTSAEALRAGAGHYTGTPLPGKPGNVAIAGHRITYGHPFRHLDRMRPGDEVTLKTPFAIYTYTAVSPFGGHGNPWVVKPTDFWVVSNQPAGRWLTLTTCHPRGSAKQRLVLRLELTGTKHLTSKGEAT